MRTIPTQIATLLKSRSMLGANAPRMVASLPDGSEVPSQYPIIPISHARISKAEDAIAQRATLSFPNVNPDDPTDAGYYTPYRGGVDFPHKPENDWKWVLVPSKEIHIEAGYGSDLTRIFTGEIDDAEFDHQPREATVNLDCRDMGWRLVDKQIVTEWVDEEEEQYYIEYPLPDVITPVWLQPSGADPIDVSLIVKDLCVRAGFAPDDVIVEDTEILEAPEFERMTYADAIEEMCVLTGFEFIVDDEGKARFFFPYDRQPEILDRELAFVGTDPTYVGKHPIVEISERVKGSTGPDGEPRYVRGVDYTVDSKQGLISRLPGSRMPEEDPGTLVATLLNPDENITAICEFNDELYAGTGGNGYSRLLKWNGTNAWIEVCPSTSSWYILSLVVYNGKIYGGSGNGTLYQWTSGTSAWVAVTPYPSDYYGIVKLLTYHGQLYAITGWYLLKWNGTNAWIEIAPHPLQGSNEWSNAIVYNDKIYALEGTTGCNLYEWGGGASFAQVAPHVDFGDANTNLGIGMYVFNGELRVITARGQILEWNGSNNWIEICPPYYTSPTTGWTSGIAACVVCQGRIFVATNTAVTLGSWRTQVLEWDGADSWVTRSAFVEGRTCERGSMTDFDDNVFMGLSAGGLFKWIPGGTGAGIPPGGSIEDVELGDPASEKVYVDYVYPAWTFKEGEDIFGLKIRLSRRDIYGKIRVTGEDTDGIYSTVSPRWDTQVVPSDKVLFIDQPYVDEYVTAQEIAYRKGRDMLRRGIMCDFAAIAVPWLQVGDCFQVIESSTTISEIYRIVTLDLEFSPQGFIMYIQAYHYGYAPIGGGAE